MQPTKQQALAFLDVLTGNEAVGAISDEEVTRPKSPLVKAHLEAVLGLNAVPGTWAVRQVEQHFLQGHPEFASDEKRDIDALAGYLEGVAARLREIGTPEEKKDQA